LRRLVGVTQVVSPGEGEVFHNRLTHTLAADFSAQVAPLKELTWCYVIDNTAPAGHQFGQRRIIRMNRSTSQPTQRRDRSFNARETWRYRWL
jgi:hypothetical protein